MFLIVVLSGGEVPTEVDNQNNDFISERERVLNSIPRKICGFRRYGKDFRKLHDAKNANEDSTPLQMPALDSMPTARVKSHDSWYKEALEMIAMEQKWRSLYPVL